jgi:phosphohistidine phosphatase
MKTLLLLRHAKSSWKEAGLRDFDRPLNKRGLKAAPLIGRFMRRKKIEPDLVLSSPAERARQTASLVVEHGRLPAETRYDERIYEADVARLLEVVSEIGDAVEEVLLVGHNPGLEELLSRLTGANERMPTAALACIELNAEEWSKLRGAGGRLAWLVKPKEL